MRSSLKSVLNDDKTLGIVKLQRGIGKNYIRECMILKQLPPHPNIIRLVEVCNSPVTETEAKVNLKSDLVTRPINEFIQRPSMAP